MKPFLFIQKDVQYRGFSKHRGVFIYGTLIKITDVPDWDESTGGRAYILEHGKKDLMCIANFVTSRELKDPFIANLEEVWPSTIHVFTGKYDMENQRIFSGDNLSFGQGDGPALLYTVYFNEENLCFEAITENGKYIIMPKLWNESKIVSNVVEHGGHITLPVPLNKKMSDEHVKHLNDGFFKCQNCGTLRPAKERDCPWCSAPWDLSRERGMQSAVEIAGDFVFEGEIKKK